MIALQILILDDDLKLTSQVHKIHLIIILWINEGRKRGMRRKVEERNNVLDRETSKCKWPEGRESRQWDDIQFGWRVGRTHRKVFSEVGKVITPHSPCKGWGLPLESSVKLLLRFRKECDLMRYIVFKDHLGCSMENGLQ